MKIATQKGQDVSPHVADMLKAISLRAQIAHVYAGTEYEDERRSRKELGPELDLRALSAAYRNLMDDVPHEAPCTREAAVAFLGVALDIMAHAVTGDDPLEANDPVYALTLVRSVRDVVAQEHDKVLEFQESPDEVSKLWERMLALRKRYRETPDDTPEGDAACDRLLDERSAIERQIAATPAGTLAGIIAKLELIRADVKSGVSVLNDALVDSLKADLEKLGAQL